MHKDILERIKSLSFVKARLLASVGSEVNNNSYSLPKTVPKSAEPDHKTTQPADKRIEFCNLWENAQTRFTAPTFCPNGSCNC